MTHKMDCGCERISPEDVELAKELYLSLERICKWRTYELCIASDTYANSEETPPGE